MYISILCCFDYNLGTIRPMKDDYSYIFSMLYIDDSLLTVEFT